MSSNSMLSLKYSWLGAGAFALFSCCVAVSGIGVSSTSHDVSLAGSVSINSHTKRSQSFSSSLPNSKAEPSKSADFTDASKAVVEVPLSAPVLDFPQSRVSASNRVSQSESTVESSKTIESTPLPAAAPHPRSITITKVLAKPKEGEKKGNNHDKTRSKMGFVNSPANLPRLTTTSSSSFSSTTTTTTLPLPLPSLVSVSPAPRLPSLPSPARLHLNIGFRSNLDK